MIDGDDAILWLMKKLWEDAEARAAIEAQVRRRFPAAFEPAKSEIATLEKMWRMPS